MYQNLYYQGYYVPSQPVRNQMANVNFNTNQHRNKGTFQRVLEGITRGIRGESQAIDFYKKLSEMAPDEKSKEDIIHALEDEEVHLRKFLNLYRRLTGNEPVFKYAQRQFDSFEDGLQKAYNDELEAYEDYRNSYLLTSDNTIRDVFFHAMTDEIEHATRFSFLLNQMK